MVAAPPNGLPQFYPSLSYDDALAAIAWLKDAFGFEEMAVYTGARAKTRDRLSMPSCGSGQEC